MVTDETSCACLSLIMARQLKHQDVLVVVDNLFIARGLRADIRLDDGREFIATAVQKRLANIGVETF